jgi:hypothetical protein
VLGIEEAYVIDQGSQSDGAATASEAERSGKRNHVGSDEWIGAKHFEVTDIAGGCITATTSALLSCLLLVINGAFVMALLSVVAASGQNWITNEKLSQFLLFSVPVILLLIQWWLIDTLRWILRRRQL